MPMLAILPQPGQVFGFYPQGFDERFPSAVLLCHGVDHHSEAEPVVRWKAYTCFGDSPGRQGQTFRQLDGLVAESLELDKFQDLFARRLLKLEETASGVAG